MIPIAKPIISWRERVAVDRVLRSGKLAQDSEVLGFEREFASRVNYRECIAVNSGTSGLHIALQSAGIGKGDEVIVPSFTFAATANSVALTGATPVFVDINLETFNIDPDAIEAAITPKTRAIQPVHLYGLPADMLKITSIAKKYELLILEDAAQAHLATIHGNPVGTFGDTAVFSFYPTKNMTSGEGGMIVCESSKVARNCRLLRNQGMEKRYDNEVVGFNYRMSDLHAAIGRTQLKKLERWTLKRQENAKFLNQNLKGVVIPKVPEGFQHVYHQYTIRVISGDRDNFAKELKKRGIETGIYYPKPVHSLPSFMLNLSLANTSTACREVLSLPIHPSLSKRELEKIVVVVNGVARAGS